jgi:hypothetical protein
MTFLELCQELAREAGISGDIAAVTGQSGEAQRVVRWIARAYKYVQNLHADWDFLRRPVEFAALLGQATYTAEAAGVTEFGRWCFRSAWRCYRTDIGYIDEQPVQRVDYDQFRQHYGYGAARLQTGRPQVVTVAPDQSLIFWPTPDAAYTVVAEHYRAPHILAANTDVPIFAARYHDAIVYRALMLYGEFEADGTVIAVGQTEAERELNAMEGFYLPGMSMSTTGALA